MCVSDFVRQAAPIMNVQIHNACFADQFAISVIRNENKGDGQTLLLHHLCSKQVNLINPVVLYFNPLIIQLYRCVFFMIHTYWAYIVFRFLLCVVFS